jgi:SAM-dependent methyltransferase
MIEVSQPRRRCRRGRAGDAIKENTQGREVTSNLQRYQRIAPLYDLLDLPFESRRYRTLRPSLFQGLTGRLLDAGVGTGRNFSFYPAGSSVVGVDISPAMLARAELRRGQLGTAIELKQRDVTCRTESAIMMGVPVRQLHAIFTDDPATAAVVGGAMRRGRSTDAAFDEAVASGLLLGRKVKAMWIIEPRFPQRVPPVVRIYGSVPIDITARHTEYLEYLAGLK